MCKFPKIPINSKKIEEGVYTRENIGLIVFVYCSKLTAPPLSHWYPVLVMMSSDAYIVIGLWIWVSKNTNIYIVYDILYQ